MKYYTVIYFLIIFFYFLWLLTRVDPAMPVFRTSQFTNQCFFELDVLSHKHRIMVFCCRTEYVIPRSLNRAGHLQRYDSPLKFTSIVSIIILGQFPKLVIKIMFVFRFLFSRFTSMPNSRFLREHRSPEIRVNYSYT